MNYASYLMRPAGWLDDGGDFHYLHEAGDESQPLGWQMLFTMHPVATEPAEDENPTEDLFDKIEHPSGRVPPCPIAKIIDLYHQHLPMCDRVMLRSDMRDQHTRTRWREVCAQGKLNTKAGLEFFDNFFASVSKSHFLTGRVNSKDRRAFKADFMWLMKPTNFVKVCEGKYTND